MLFSIVGPEWRNWQTRRTQNPVAARPCGFDPLLRDHFFAKAACVPSQFILTVPTNCCALLRVRTKSPTLNVSSEQLKKARSEKSETKCIESV
jgi:hypothetical protein